MKLLLTQIIFLFIALVALRVSPIAVILREVLGRILKLSEGVNISVWLGESTGVGGRGIEFWWGLCGVVNCWVNC